MQRAQDAVERIEAAEQESVLNLLSSFGNSSVLQGYLQTDVGLVHITAFSPQQFSADEEMVLTSGSDIRVEVVGHIIQQAAEMSPGPIMVSITRGTDDIASKFTDSTMSGGVGSSLHSSLVSINLRRNNGSALEMKSLRKPMVVVMKLTGQEGNATCAYWDEDEYRWSTEGVTALGTTNSELRCETTHLSIFGAVLLSTLLQQELASPDCEVGSWTPEGMVVLFKFESALQVLGSHNMSSAGHVVLFVGVCLFLMAVAWGVYSQQAQDDKDVKDTILNRSTGQAMTFESVVGACILAASGYRTGLEPEIVKALGSSVGRRRSLSRSFSSSSARVTRSDSSQKLGQSSTAWEVPSRLQDLPQLQNFVCDFEVLAQKRRAAEDFVDAPWSIRTLQMFLATHEWLAVHRFSLFTQKHVRIAFVFFKLLVAAAFNALFLSGMPAVPEECPAPSGFGSVVQFILVGVGSAFVADALRYGLFRLRQRSTFLVWVLWLILVLLVLFFCLIFLAVDGDQWLESLGASLLQEILLGPMVYSMYVATRATVTLKNPDVLDAVVRKWIDEDEEASPGGEPSAVLQVLPSTPAGRGGRRTSFRREEERGETEEKRVTFRRSQANAGDGPKNFEGIFPKEAWQEQPESSPSLKSNRIRMTERRAAYQKAYDEALEDGRSAAEAKELATAAFRRVGHTRRLGRAGSSSSLGDGKSPKVTRQRSGGSPRSGGSRQSSPRQMEVPGHVEESSDSEASEAMKANRSDLARKGEVYRIAYERAIDWGMEPDEAKEMAKAAYRKA